MGKLRLLTDPLDDTFTYYKPAKVKPDEPPARSDPNVYYIGEAITSTITVPDEFDGLQITLMDTNSYRANLIVKKTTGRYVGMSWFVVRTNPLVDSKHAEYVFTPPLDEPKPPSKKFRYG